MEPRPSTAGEENSVDIFHQNEFNIDLNEKITIDGSYREDGDRVLKGGLGLLTDTIEGANSFTMEIGYGLGMLSFLLVFCVISCSCQNI